MNRKGVFAAVLLVTTATVASWAVLQAEDPQGVSDADAENEEEESSVPATVGPDRSNFVGARACIDCHRSEYVAWLNTSHYSNKADRFEGTENSIDTKYRELTGSVDRCYSCHSLPLEERFGRHFVESGTSCESCHGASGGEHGWLNRHAVYGPNVTRIEQESAEHRAERIAFCESAGMVRSEKHYAVAKTCFKCHIVGDELLVEAGHKSSFDSFSLVPRLQGEVRHNFHLDQRTNAKAPTLDTYHRDVSADERYRVLFIVEQLARMNVAWSNIAALPDDEESLEREVAAAMLDILDDAAGQLEEFAEVLMEEPNEEGQTLTEDQLQPLFDAVEEFTDFDELDVQTREAAAAAALNIDGFAAEFLRQQTGQQLGVLDTEFLEDVGEPVGKALEP